MNQGCHGEAKEVNKETKGAQRPAMEHPSHAFRR